MNLDARPTPIDTRNPDPTRTLLLLIVLTLLTGLSLGVLLTVVVYLTLFTSPGASLLHAVPLLLLFIGLSLATSRFHARVASHLR